MLVDVQGIALTVIVTRDQGGGMGGKGGGYRYS